MIWPKRLFKYFQTPLVERLRLYRAPLGAIYFGNIVQGMRDIRIIGARCFLADRKLTPLEGFAFGIPSQVHIHLR